MIFLNHYHFRGCSFYDLIYVQIICKFFFSFFLTDNQNECASSLQKWLITLKTRKTGWHLKIWYFPFVSKFPITILQRLYLLFSKYSVLFYHVLFLFIYFFSSILGVFASSFFHFISSLSNKQFNSNSHTKMCECKCGWEWNHETFSHHLDKCEINKARIFLRIFMIFVNSFFS